MSDAQDWRRQWSQMVAQAWSDDSYRQRLLSDPKAVMEEGGLTPPAEKQVRMMEDTADTVHVVLPARPANLSDEQLDQAVGGAAGSCSAGSFTVG